VNPRPLPRHLHAEHRHGRIDWYVRRGHGPRTRIFAAFDTPEFWAEYRAALEGTAPAAKRKASTGTLRWALDLYRSGGEWAQLAPATRKQRENIYINVLKTAGDTPLKDITREAIRNGRDRRAEHPGAANNFLKSMRPFFAWALDRGLVDTNPTEGVKALKLKGGEGFAVWSEDDIARFERHWPVGTRERLALDLLLYTGLRRGDVVRVGRQHVRDGVITIRTEKTGTVVDIPLLDPLAASIAATKTGDLAFLATSQGRPFVKESFANWFRIACKAAGCSGSAHGLRKAAATRVAEGGANDRALMALFGWSSSRMASHYTRSADRKRLAATAAVMLLPAQKKNTGVPQSRSVAGKRRKTAKKTGA